MTYLILDIETVPRKDLPFELEEAIKKKTEKRVETTGSEPAEAESLIRSVSPFFGQVLCIGLRWYDDYNSSIKDRVICEKTEEETLQKFFEVINHSSTQRAKFVHYNGLGFDIPFLIIRAAHYGIEINNSSFKNLRRFSFQTHIDLMMFLASWSNYNAVSLDIACQSFGIPSPKQGEVKGNTVAKAFDDGNIQAVEEYVMRDVEATFKLFEKLKQYIV